MPDVSSCYEHIEWLGGKLYRCTAKSDCIHGIPLEKVVYCRLMLTVKVKSVTDLPCICRQNE